MLNLTNVFRKNVDAYKAGYRYIVNQGGTSASKTFSTLQILVQIASRYPKQIDIVGLTVPHLKAGVINDMPRVMEGFGLNFHDMYNSTDKVIRFPSGGIINFISIDKLGKAHGGRRDILFLNEANHQVWAIVEQLMIRTRDVVFIDYNPTNEFWVHSQIMAKEQDKAMLIKSTYLDNEFLEPTIVQSIESKRGDGTNNFWRVYGLGELGIAEGLVFTNFEVADFDQYGFDKYINGLDWGFSNDPFAFLRSSIKNNNLYICEEIYQKGLMNKDSAEIVKRIVRNEVVWCDAAEPKSIQEYQSLGVKAHAAKKGAGSIESGIKKIQSFRNVIIHPTCINAHAEFKNYQWKKNNKGEQIAEPVSGFDHCLVPETLITTDKGLVRIDAIKVGDLVLTRKGYRKVLFAGVTARNEKAFKVISRRTSITGTANHYILTQNGFTRIDALRYGDYILTYKECKSWLLSLLFMMGLFGVLILKELVRVSQSIIKTINFIYTTMFGKNIMGLVKKACIYTTLMVTPLTTIFQTYKKLALKSMLTIISFCLQKNKSKNASKIWIQLDTLLKSGTRAKLVKRGIVSMQKIAGSDNLLLGNMTVFNVKKSLKQKRKVSLSALINAKAHIAAIWDMMTLRSYAQFVWCHLRQASIPNKLLVVSRVLGVIEGKKEPKLYDLTIEGQPEFFADGVLVHNCIDALRYSLVTEMVYTAPSVLTQPYEYPSYRTSTGWMGS